MTTAPSRDDSVTTTSHCPECGGDLVGARGRQRYCSAACRQRAYRARQPHPDEPPPPDRRATRATAIYQCPDCDTRLLAQQRCPDCNTFCTRLGTGGLCPCCDEPVTLDELLNT